MQYLTKHWVEVVSLIVFATVHGYFGAWLAVRMLFRPRRPVKIFGLTIFPQGMVPRHRERLAAAIGKAVGEELVSQETIVEELFGKEFLRKKIQGMVDSYTEDLISQNYPSLIEALPSNVREPVLDAISTLQMKIAEHIDEVLRSEETIENIRNFVERRVDEVLSQRVSDVLDEENLNKILGFLEERIRASVKTPAFEQKVRDFIGRRVDDLANLETPLGELFTPDAVALLKEKAGEQIQPIVHQLTELATAERTRTQISSLIKKEVHQYYENLPFFKKIFVSRDNLLKDVDDLVNDSLPKRIEETLRGDFFAQEAKGFLDTTIDNAMGRPLPALIGKIAPEQLDRLKAQINRNVLALLQGDEMMNSISAYLSDTIHKLRPHSIDAILETVHPHAEEKLKRMLSKGLLNVLSRHETTNIINSVLSNQIEGFLGRPIGKLADHISEEQVRRTGKSLTETIITAAKEKLPAAIKEFDVGGVVREKINHYPVEKLESLILSVAKEHLRTIELFGALFGAIIGIVQSFIAYAGDANLFTRFFQLFGG
ncbi:MAG: DUF445 family protein [Acidobacteria bacterium]|nr:DUF445 family protein [Acidobacteriota bacterium]